MLSDEQILLLRREIGDTGHNAIISGAELQLAYQQADGDWEQTRLTALRWLHSHYAKCDLERATQYQSMIDRTERDIGLQNGGILLGLGEG
jgi:hypothetical protein